MQSLHKVKKIEQEVISFMEVLTDYHTKTKLHLSYYNERMKRYDEHAGRKHTPAKDTTIDGTKESAALKAAYKVLKYKLDKIIL
jgi:hypothetical protein